MSEQTSKAVEGLKEALERAAHEPKSVTIPDEGFREMDGWTALSLGLIAPDQVDDLDALMVVIDPKGLADFQTVPKPYCPMAARYGEQA